MQHSLPNDDGLRPSIYDQGDPPLAEEKKAWDAAIRTILTPLDRSRYGFFLAFSRALQVQGVIPDLVTEFPHELKKHFLIIELILSIDLVALKGYVPQESGKKFAGMFFLYALTQMSEIDRASLFGQYRKLRRDSPNGDLRHFCKEVVLGTGGLAPTDELVDYLLVTCARLYQMGIVYCTATAFADTTILREVEELCPHAIALLSVDSSDRS